jgi:hypothetical protein
MKAEQYRRLAAGCIDMASGTDGPQFKAALIDMAGAWLRLAEQAEKNGGRGGIRTHEGAETPWRFSRPLP